MRGKCYLVFSRFLLILAFDLVIVFLCLYFFLSENFIPNDFDKLAVIISGITAPFIAIAAAILTFLAFKMQVIANEQVQKQFELQQFESQFFKFLDTYISIVDRIKYQSRFSGEYFEGKDYFYVLHLEFKELLKDIRKFHSKCPQFRDNLVTSEYSSNILELNIVKNVGENKKEELFFFFELEIAYVILYFGAGKTGRKNVKELLRDKYNREYIKLLLNYLSNIPKDKKNIEFVAWQNKSMDVDFQTPNNYNFTRFYNGHQGRLGHYYRQLFGAIGYANKQNYINYLDKWDYVRHFRSLFSNYEQIMFFLNSISILGRSWELDVKDLEGKSKEEVNKERLNKGLVTKYDLIKNIPSYQIDEYQIKKFYPNVDFDGYENTIDRGRLDKEVYQ